MQVRSTFEKTIVTRKVTLLCSMQLQINVAFTLELAKRGTFAMRMQYAAPEKRTCSQKRKKGVSEANRREIFVLYIKEMGTG